MPDNMNDDDNKMKFRSIGGSKQLTVEDADDMKNVLTLPAAQWAMTNISCDSIVCDKEFITFVDSDSNGRIRSDEVKLAVSWLLSCFKDFSGINAKTSTISIAALDTSSADGKIIHTAICEALANLEISDAESITLEQISDRKNILANALRNGDGVIPPEPLGDTPEAECVRRIMASGKTHKDINTSDGINFDDLESFKSLLENYLLWFDAKNAAYDTIMPFAEKTPSLYGAYKKIADKIDDYFLSSSAIVYVGSAREDIVKVSNVFDPLDPESVKEFLSKSPVAPVSGAMTLSTESDLNSIYADFVKDFFKSYTDVQGKNVSEISFAEWKTIKEKLSPYENHLSKKNTDIFDGTDIALLKSYFEDGIFAKLETYIEEDKAVAESIAGCETARKLMLYQKNMLDFLNNFVNMRDLFDSRTTSMLQVGRLVMDGRHFTLCTLVNNVPEHKNIIAKSDICAMYIDISTGKGSTFKSMKLAVAVTSGHMRNLFIGKCGIFITPDGTVWDAKVFDFIQQPVSISEAIRAPFYKFGDFLQKQADKFFSTKSKNYEDSVAKGIQDMGTNTTVAVPPPVTATQTPAFSGSMMLMGGGIGIAAIGSAFAFIARVLQEVSVGSVVAVIFGILLIFGGPMILVSLIKLFSRNLSLFIEGNSVAMNYKMRMTLKLGRLFTFTPKLPKGAAFSPLQEYFCNDSVESEKARRNFVIRIVFIVIFIVISFVVSYYYTHKFIHHIIN